MLIGDEMAMPPLTSLRVFESVARLGSFKAAADALFVTQSAVSHQIRNVEDWMGKPLFLREGNRTRLLPEGADLARSLSVSLTEIEAACQRARARSTSQTLVIAAIPSVAMCWLIPRLSRFRAAHPGIETRVVYAMHGRDINFHDVHLAFVFSSSPPVLPNVAATFFLAGTTAPVCSPTLLTSFGRKPETLSDYLQLGLLHDGSTAGWQDWLQLKGSQDGAGISGATFEDFNLLRAAALSGQGVALCSLEMVGPDLRNGSLVQLSDRTTTGGSDYYLLSITNADRQTARHAEVFLSWATAERDQPLAPASPK